jgi:hypothetical protein
MAFPATFNISYYRGDKYEIVVRPKDSAGNPFDLATYTPFFYISTARGANASLTRAGVATINGNNILATITPSIGRQLAAGTTYFYDVSIQKNAGEIYTLLTGTLSVTNDITSPGS